MAATAEVAAAGKVGELDAVSRGDDQLARVRIVEGRPGAGEGVRVGQERRVAVGLPAACRRREAELLARPTRNRFSSLEEEHRLRARFGVEARRQLASVLSGLAGPVDHAGPVRSGHDHTRVLEPVLQAYGSLDARLSVVGAENHGVTLQE